MSKSHRKFKSKPAKPEPSRSVEQARVSDIPEQTCSENQDSTNPPQQGLKTLVGVIDTGAYERFLKPAFEAFSLSHDDSALRQIIEIISTSIALCDNPTDYRVIDDICQRYLYYHEHIACEPQATWENVCNRSLCDYWRTQTFMMLIRNSASIFSLLQPNTENSRLPVLSMNQQDFLDAVSFVLNDSLAHVPDAKIPDSCKSLYDFSRGISLPWLGYDPAPIFSLQSSVPDELLRVKQSFAILSQEVVSNIYPQIRAQIEHSFFIDIIYTQYKKTYEDLCAVYFDQESIPEGFLELLHQRIKLDKNYQNLLDQVLQGKNCTQKCHRSSRLEPELLNRFSQIFSMIKYAVENHLGLYLFHYVD